MFTTFLAFSSVDNSRLCVSHIIKTTKYRESQMSATILRRTVYEKSKIDIQPCYALSFWHDVKVVQWCSGISETQIACLVVVCALKVIEL